MQQKLSAARANPSAFHAPDLGEKGVLRAGRWRWAKALAWLLFCLVVLTLELSLQSVVKSLVPSESLALAMAYLTVLIVYGSYLILVKAGEKRSPSELTWRPIVRELPAGLGIGMGLMTLIILFLYATGLCSITAGRWADWPHDVRETLGTGFLEELLARLVIFRLLSRAFGIRAGLAISSLSFGAAHLFNPHASLTTSLAIAIEAGLLFAGFYLLTGRIWTSIGAHAGWNFAQGGVFGARVSGFPADGSLLVTTPAASAPTWLSGGDFGPEGSLAAIMIGVIAFAITMALVHRRDRRASGAD